MLFKKTLATGISCDKVRADTLAYPLNPLTDSLLEVCAEPLPIAEFECVPVPLPKKKKNDVRRPLGLRRIHPKRRAGRGGGN